MTSGEISRYDQTTMVSIFSGKTIQAPVFFRSYFNGASWFWGCVSMEL